jgi:hypothetical protein
MLSKCAFRSLLFLTAMSFAIASHAMSRAEYAASVSQAKADYKAAIAECRSLRGNDRDVCKKEAKANYTRDKTNADADYKGTAHAQAEAVEEQSEANYKVAKEKCESLSGDAKAACIQRAKMPHPQ